METLILIQLHQTNMDMYMSMELVQHQDLELIHLRQRLNLTTLGFM